MEEKQRKNKTRYPSVSIILGHSVVKGLSWGRLSQAAQPVSVQASRGGPAALALCGGCSEPCSLSEWRPPVTGMTTLCPCPESSRFRLITGPQTSALKMIIPLVCPLSNQLPATLVWPLWGQGRWRHLAIITHSTASS